jgi:adenylate kinase
VNIILFGPPGAGKGTQANNLVNNFNLHKVSAGDLLRNEVENKTDIGDKIKHNLDQGLFYHLCLLIL